MLNNLYKDYNIKNLSGGSKSDALGDLYEEYFDTVLLSDSVRDNFNAGKINSSEDEYYDSFMRFHGISNVDSVKKIQVPKLDSGGSPKTDTALAINGDLILRVSIKATQSVSVTAAEFDVETITNNVGITDPSVIQLMEKHQKDASAKYMTKQEKQALKDGLQQYAKGFGRWVLTGDADQDSKDIRVANLICVFKLSKEDRKLINYSIHHPDEYIKKMQKRSSGFGTGLSWTYAKSSKYNKIQFKCPVY